MQSFTNLYNSLDENRAAYAKVESLKNFFRAATPEDAAWALALLTGKRPPRAVSTRLLRTWVSERSGFPLWLIEASYDVSGDLSEALALTVTDAGSPVGRPLHWWMQERVIRLSELDDNGKRLVVEQAWSELDAGERMVWNKLITGTFRASASRAAVEQALAETSHVPQSIIARRLAESWEPTATAFLALMSPDQAVNEGGSVSARSVAPPAEDAEVPEHVPRAHFAVNAVLIYAQPGKSRGSSVSTEYTFGVWAAGELVPIAKLPLESPEATERRIASFVRQNTLQRFGPVRTVAPVIVAELAFEAVSPSARHKSGLVLRSPKVMRIRDDKRAEEADSLDALTSLIGT